MSPTTRTRDLKPGNIMLTEAGAKLLDFGLAKLRTPGPAGAEAFSAATTLDEPLTTRGMLLGTLPYMAPGQVEGKETDARPDLFAFGAVVYEMVAGRRPFAGDTQAGLIGAILERELPSLSAIQPMAPPALETTVRRCLSKDQEERWQDARDLLVELDRIAAGQSPAVAPPERLSAAEHVPAAPPTQRLGWPSAIVKVACMAVIGIIFAASMCGLAASP